MFDDDTDYSSILWLILDDVSLPPVGSELQQKGATATDRSCPSCNGTLYDADSEVVCGTCSLVIGAESHTHVSHTRWDVFDERRPQYRNSQRYRCVGGFPGPHDWVTSEDTDRTVRSLDPEVFYGEQHAEND